MKELIKAIYNLTAQVRWLTEEVVDLNNNVKRVDSKLEKLERRIR